MANHAGIFSHDRIQILIENSSSSVKQFLEYALGSLANCTCSSDLLVDLKPSHGMQHTKRVNICRVVTFKAEDSMT